MKEFYPVSPVTIEYTVTVRIIFVPIAAPLTLALTPNQPETTNENNQ
jgi:hypothetical protein